MIPETILIAVATGIFVGGSVWGLAWWLSGRFDVLTKLIYESINKTEAAIMNKLEYHERHDDARFDDLKRDLWDVKLRQASNVAHIRDLEKLQKKTETNGSQANS
jgi:hypothetical protein